MGREERGRKERRAQAPEIKINTLVGKECASVRMETWVSPCCHMDPSIVQSLGRTLGRRWGWSQREC